MAHIPDQNIRDITKLNDGELEAAMAAGWNENLPAIQDENGRIIVGNRRMRVAKKIGIKPVIKVVTFGDGPEAEASRTRLAFVSNTGAVPVTKEERKAYAIKLYQSGATQKAIADMLGVDQATVSRDLCNVHKSKQAKTASNPKGAGRPKSSGNKKAATKPTPKPKSEPKPVQPVKPRVKANGESKTPVLDKCRDIVRPMIANDEEVNYVKLQGMYGHSHVKFEEAANIERTLKEEPPVDLSTLSITAQEKVNIACRQALRKQEAEVWAREHAHAKRWLEEQLAEHLENERHYGIVLKARSGFMPKATFNKIRMALHPDTYQNVSAEARNELVQAWEEAKVVMLNEAEHPTRQSNLPKTVEELLRRAAAKKAAV